MEIEYWPWPSVGASGPRPRHPSETPKRRALIVEDPDGSLIDAAVRERAAVSAACLAAGLDVEVLAGPEANARHVLERLRGTEVFHFIGHGYFDWRDPRGSGLAMTDGNPLTARALGAGTDLRGCRLAMLSACETGLSDPGLRGDAFVGMSADLLEAGAGTVIAALWQVPNESTPRLVAALYDAVLGGRMTPARALRKAALAARDGSPDTPGLPAATWAAFAAYSRG